MFVNFGSFHLDLRSGRLMQGTRAIALRPKTWAVLRYLAERPGELITKDELLTALWPNVAVSEDTLSKSIGELRNALGDEAKAPRFIETVHRRGFRFVATISRETAIAIDDVPMESKPVGTHGEPFVGRADELGRLAALLAKASSGERQMVFVIGPAGIGKTALVEAFLASPRVREGSMPVWVARGLCLQHHGATLEPYMAVLEALDRVARGPDADRVVRLLRQMAPTWLAQMPRLNTVEDSAPAVGTPRLPVSGPNPLLRELANFVEALSAAGTLVLVLEDLHWSDPSTVDLLSVLAQRNEPARLLVIGTYRPAEVAVQEHVLSQLVRTLQLHRQSVEMPVHELREPDVRDYLQKRFAGASFTAGLARLIHDHTDGNPLFVVAIVNHMLSRGWILETAPGWALSLALDQLELGVPDDVRRLIETQLEGLHPAQRSLLEAISVSARGLTARAVAAALDRDANDTELHVEVLAHTLRFIRETDDRHYTFVHELYRHVVYEGTPEGRRRRLHLRLGAALEAAYGVRASQIAFELALHFDRGRDAGRAIHYFAIAAESARQRFANREAIGYLVAALDAVALLPDAAERRSREFELRVALAQPLHELHGFASERVRENAERAYALSTDVGSPTDVFEVVHALWFLHAARADPAAITLATRLDDLAQRLGTPESRLQADSVLVRTAAYDGRFVQAHAIAERRLTAKGDPVAVQGRAEYGVDPLIAAQCHYAHALWFLGHPDRAQATMHAALTRAQTNGAPFTLAAALCNAGMLEVFRRNTTAVGELVDRMTALSAVHEFAFWHAMAAILAGWVAVQRDRVHEGIAAIEQGLAAYRATGARALSSYFLAFLAEARGCARAFTAGLSALDEGLILAETTLDRGYEPELWRLKGELLLASSPSGPLRSRRVGDDGGRAAADEHGQDAEQCLLRAVESARLAQTKSLELRAAVSLSRAWQGRGRGAEARALLGGLCDWFGAGPAGADLTAARALLGALEPSRDRVGGSPRAVRTPALRR